MKKPRGGWWCKSCSFPKAMVRSMHSTSCSYNLHKRKPKNKITHGEDGGRRILHMSFFFLYSHFLLKQKGKKSRGGGGALLTYEVA
jgi:hypothetical protein